MPCRFDHNCFSEGLGQDKDVFAEAGNSVQRMPVHSVGCEAGSLYCSEWTLNALLTTSSSLRKCSRPRISGPSAQAMSLLRIEGMMKPSPTVHGSGSGRILESAAGPGTRSSQRLSDGRVCSLDFASNLNSDNAVSHSSEWAITQPIQLQDSFSAVAKPSVYLLFGQWVIARAELLVEPVQ